MKLKIILSYCVLVCMLTCTRAADERMILAAGAFMRLPKNCNISMNYSEKSVRNNEQLHVKTGTIKFAEAESHLISQRELVIKRNTDGKTIAENSQIYLARDDKSLICDYQRINSKPVITSIYVHPSEDYHEGLRDCYNEIGIDILFGPYFMYYGSSLTEIAKEQPSQIRETANGDIQFEYTFPLGIGKLLVNLTKLGDAYYIVSAALNQSSVDLYTLPNILLRDVKKSVVGSHPDGLTSRSNLFDIEYFQSGDSVIPKSIRINAEWRAGKDWFKQNLTLTTTSYSEIHTADDVKLLRIAVPEGHQVNSLDPDFENISLVYKDGRIVRAVDGASVNQVVAEQQRPRVPRAVWFVAAVVLVLVTAGGVVWWRRRAGGRG